MSSTSSCFPKQRCGGISPVNLLPVNSICNSLLLIPRPRGMVPENWFRCKETFLRFLSSVTSKGNSPDRLLLNTRIYSRLGIFQILAGISPVKRLLNNSSRLNLLSFPISLGISPSSLFSFSSNSVRDLQFPSSGGILPDKEFSAR
uniref:Uncharacterized protein n=1 Tax=Opuntia streptacantha TaxID=393608 RepID=A0A7C9AG34_OPUST